jgi:hypothetical protein
MKFLKLTSYINVNSMYNLCSYVVKIWISGQKYEYKLSSVRTQAT